VKTTKVKVQTNTAEEAMVRLMRVGDRIWRQSDEWFARWEIMDNHYNVMRILNGAGEPISQIEISRRMLSSRANVTKLIDLLEKRGFVKRHDCGDRRVNLVGLTEKGAKFIEETVTEVTDFAETMMKPLSKQEQRTLVALLAKLSGE
jgi:MarR family 2-MHQ and catechol resistance regulon transcriptional repressor